ncbi:MAG: FecR domain-containing protein, partial [Thermodesulfobacteriota bacterium]|nr:FecR domain-containing protein [Thermodesulfobacteriota bacterium]
MKRTVFFMILLFLLNPLCLSAQAKTVGKFSKVEGRVDITRLGAPAILVHKGDEVGVGDIIRVKSKSKAEIIFGDGGILRIAQKSRVKIDEYIMEEERKKGIFNLFRGKIENVLKKTGGFFGFKKKNKLEVHTPTAVCGVRGTDFFSTYQKSISNFVFKEGRGYGYSKNRPDQVMNINTGQAMLVIKPDVLPIVRMATAEEIARHSSDTAIKEEDDRDEEKKKDERVDEGAGDKKRDDKAKDKEPGDDEEKDQKPVGDEPEDKEPGDDKPRDREPEDYEPRDEDRGDDKRGDRKEGDRRRSHYARAGDKPGDDGRDDDEPGYDGRGDYRRGDRGPRDGRPDRYGPREDRRGDDGTGDHRPGGPPPPGDYWGEGPPPPGDYGPAGPPPPGDYGQWGPPPPGDYWGEPGDFYAGDFGPGDYWGGPDDFWGGPDDYWGGPDDFWGMGPDIAYDIYDYIPGFRVDNISISG